MSGFIPMVSTTPPPMDGPPDDDFADFVEGSMDETESDSYMDQSIPSFSPTFSPIKKPHLPLDQDNHNNEEFNSPYCTKHATDDEFDDFTEFHEPSNGFDPSQEQEDNPTEFSKTQINETANNSDVQLNNYNSKIESQKTSHKIDLFDDSNFVTNNVNVDDFQDETSENNSNEFEDENLNKYAASDSEPEPTNVENTTTTIANDDETKFDCSFGGFEDDNQNSSDVRKSDNPNQNQLGTQTNTACNNTQNEKTLAALNDEGANALNTENDNFSMANKIENNVNETENKDIGTGTEENDDDFGAFSDEEVVLPIVNNDISTNGALDNVDINDDIQSDNSFGAFSDEENIVAPNIESTQENQVKQALSEDDDFGKFSDKEDAVNNNNNDITNSSEHLQKLNDVSLTEATKEEEDEFAEFADFGDNVQSTTNNVNVVSDETPKDTVEDDFGNFSDDDDDFGNFDDFSNNQSFPTTQTKPQPQQRSTKSIHDKISSVSGQYMTTLSASDDDTEPLPPLHDWIHEDILELNKNDNREDDNSMVWAGDVWENLEDIDNTAALSYVWNGSQHNKGLLQSLGLDINHIMFSGKNKAYYVPSYYAIGLDTLDYNKGILKPMSAAEKITAISPKDKTAPVNALSVNAGITEEWTAAEEEQIEDIGPVIDPSSFDVDFLETHEAQTKTSASVPSKTDLMDPSLLELSTAPTIDLPPVKDTGSAKLSKLLASLKTSSSSPASSIQTGSVLTSDEEETLSLEAKEVIKKLPDLSYMRSKVLMFPVNIMTRVKMSDQ